MYKCHSCGLLFQEPDIFYETHGSEQPPYEAVNVCPSCHAQDYESAFVCDGCGEWCTGHYETADGGIWCDNCCHYVEGK